jgi:hypothetical protein
MATAASSASAAADQSNRVGSYKAPKPELPSDRVDPTAYVPPLPPGTVVEKFEGQDTFTAIGVVLILGALAYAVSRRRR